MKIDKLANLLNLRAIEKELFLQLVLAGPLTASQLAGKASISRTSVYDLLKSLIEAGVVAEVLKGGTRIFMVQPPEKIQLLIEEKEKEIFSARLELEDLKKNYSDQVQLSPRLQLFEGKKELQQMMKDLLLYRDITVLAFWPVKKIINSLGPEFFSQFHQERLARNIKIQVIWPPAQIPATKFYPLFGVGPELKRQVRIAPAGLDFSLGYAIYGNTVRFISSDKENFGFLVESKELAEMMRSQFQIIWRIAKPLH